MYVYKKFKNSTAKYYQKNKERLQKRSVKGIKTYPKKKKKMKKKNDMGMTYIKICLKTKNKGWLNIEKIS